MARPRPPAPAASYGPSLPELLGPRLRALARWQRVALLIAALALAAVIASLVVKEEASTKTYTQRAGEAPSRGLAPIAFSFDYSRKLRRSHPAGAYVQVERVVNGTLAARFTVSELELGRQSGLLSGFLPIVATHYERRAAARFEGFRLQAEGKARVNDVEGYQFAFNGRLPRPGGRPRQLFGRVVMLPEPFDVSDLDKPYPPGRTPTHGLLITMLATSLDNVPSATRVGDEGTLQRPFRSFRFKSGASSS
jgi:hypothetical protein